MKIEAKSFACPTNIICNFKECPIRSVHIRLNDAHLQWHMMATSYKDANLFRVNLNSCIQTLRSVTWLLQKNKHVINNFDSWYKDWQESFRNNSIMKWLTNARNMIVKEGDLELHSTLIASIHEDYLHKKLLKPISFNPFTPDNEIIDNIVSEYPFEESYKDCVVKIERAWVSVDLSNQELLSVLSYAYRLMDTHT